MSAESGDGVGIALALGRASEGSKGWSEMFSYLLISGIRPSEIGMISNPTEYVEWMSSAESIHFNMKDINSDLLSDPTRFTAQEWQHLLKSPELWSKTIVYNIPDTVHVPDGIRIGQGF